MHGSRIDFYFVLGVSPKATAEEIKVAYRRLAIRHHPDKQGDVFKFKEVNDAHAVLGDPEKRRAYDDQRNRSVVENLTVAAGSVVDDYFRQFARP